MLESVTASTVETCQQGKVCLVLSEKTFEVVADVSEEKSKCVVDHPIMLLASKLGDLHL